MEKFKSEADLKAAIVEVFNFNKGAQVLHVTNDGQCFLEDSKNAADMHARKNNLKVTTVNREDYKSDSDKPVGFELMTIATLKEELSKLQIAFDDKAKKADLVALLTEAKAK